MPRSDNTLEKKKWYKNTTAVFALAGSVMGLIVAVVGLWPKPEPRPVPPPPDPPLQNVEIVLDRSGLMSEPFENGTKLSEAKAEITQLLDKSVSTADNLALREFGGPTAAPATPSSASASRQTTGIPSKRASIALRPPDAPTWYVR